MPRERPFLSLESPEKSDVCLSKIGETVSSLDCTSCPAHFLSTSRSQGLIDFPCVLKAFRNPVFRRYSIMEKGGFVAIMELEYGGSLDTVTRILMYYSKIICSH